MKVLLAVDEYPPHIWGGMGKSVRLLAESLFSLKVEIIVLTVNRQSDSIIQNRYRNINVFRVPSKKEKVFLRTFLAKENPDLIHINGRHYGKLAKFFHYNNIRIIYTSRSNFLEEVRTGSLRFNKRKLQNQELLLRLANYVVTTSKNESKSLMSDYPWIKNKLVIIPNGIDLKEDKPLELDDKLKFLRSKMVFFAGRFVKQKGIDTLLSLIPQIFKENKKASIVVAGGHGKISYENKLLELANEYPKLSYKGWLNEKQLQKYYKQASIVLMPSSYEPFGLVITEAMVKSCVVIAHPASGPREIIRSGLNGFLVDRTEKPQILHLIHDILENQPRTNKIRTQALKTVISEYTINRTAKLYLKLYKQCYEN